MTGRRRILIPIILTMILMLVGVSARPMQQVTGEGDWYFPETKKTVSGEFLDYYRNTQDYLIKIGFPISDVVAHPVLPGVLVQYFQKVRLELYPNEPAGKRVRLASLGVWLYDETNRGDPADLPYAAGACRTFTTHEIAVCYEFLKFYDNYGGADFFGDPISVMEKMSNGRLVQYFERARMEWWPEHPQGQRVVLTYLGALYMINSHLPPPIPGDPKGPTAKQYEIKAHAFTAKPLVSPNSSEIVYVIVTDQTGQPVAGALVTLVVHLPDGTNLNQRAAETGPNGLTLADVSVGNLQPNQVIQVDVSVTIANGGETTTSTYFRIWW